MGTGPALMPCSRKAPDSHSSPTPPILPGHAAQQNTDKFVRPRGICCTRAICPQAPAQIHANEYEWTRRGRGREGLPILGGNPVLEETGERIYFRGEYFTNFSTSSRCLAQRAQRVPHFHGATGYREWCSAFRHVVSFRCECRIAKWAHLIPRARPHRSMQQIHGLRPFFQYDPRGAFRASAAKIRVHRKPPRVSGDKRGPALSATKKAGRLPRSKESASELLTLRFRGFYSIQWNP